MNSYSHSATAAVPSPSKHPPSPDRPIRISREELYPKEVWFFLASFIFLVALLQFVSFLYTKTRRIAKPRSSDSESRSVPIGRGISLRWIPLAASNAYRAIAFRSTISIGQCTLNVAEVVLTAMYIIALFTWEFINSLSYLTVSLTPHLT